MPATVDWTRDQFIALALSYAARADLEISEPERAYMKSLCSEEDCEKALTFSETHSDYEVVQTLIRLKEEFFPGAEGKEKLTQILTGLFQSDDDYSQLEHNVMRGLQRVL